MVSFKQFLESKVHDYSSVGNLSDVDIEKEVITKCSNAVTALKNGVGIYRGWRRPNMTQGIADPSTGERISQNTDNFYTQWFDTNPENDRWPKRSKSFICTTDKQYAEDYAVNGSVTLMLPFDGVGIASATRFDIWEVPVVTLGKFKFYLPDLNKAALHFFKEQKMEVPKTFSEFKSALAGINEDDFFAYMADSLDTGGNFYGNFVAAIRSGGVNVDDIKQLQHTWPDCYAFDNNFELHDSVSTLQPNREVWFSGKCVFINVQNTMLIDLINKL